ncbi:MAG TPA: hypothetical protein VHC42_02160 [Rhizomicrobium sp.]|nr:hypothetical protein [Rhizomicrobium sp.]
MSDFEGLFGLFALMFGLIVAELTLKFADAIDSNRERPMGILTPALALLVLTDVTTFWLFIWADRHALKVNWHTVFGGVIVSIIYFLAATLVFPRTSHGWKHLDDHYWARKRLVATGILFANFVMLGMMLARVVPAWNDWLFYLYFVGYYLAVAGLMFSRSRRLDYVFLVWALAINFGAGSDLLPNSGFGEQLGLSFSERR